MNVFSVLPDNYRISTSEIPEPEINPIFKSVFSGVRGPSEINFSTICHDAKIPEAIFPTPYMYRHIESLVYGYKFPKRVYEILDMPPHQVREYDDIHGYFGIREMSWLEQNWESTPMHFRKWVNKRPLLGLGTIVADSHGHCYCSSCKFGGGIAKLDWHPLAAIVFNDLPNLFYHLQRR